VADLSFAILIPAHNEAADIRRTLDAAVAVRYPRKEVIVIDDASTDDTAGIVSGYSDRGVRLIRMPANRGVAAARNVGLRSTEAEAVIILNADVLLPPDFMERLAPHYEAGADFVVVESQAANMQNLFARFMQAYHDMAYKTNPAEGHYDWSEGWSCRRETALAVGGFPEEFPGASGEDAIFVNRLLGRYKRVYDPNIVVTDYVPHTLYDFWKQRLGRGRGIAYRRFGYEKVQPRLWPMLRAWLGALLWLGSIVLPLWQGAKLAQYSPRGWRDWPGMVWSHVLDVLGHQLGYWRAYRRIVASAKVN
jgi:glycosyltransferase involved in cell wall biosynthesis